LQRKLIDQAKLKLFIGLELLPKMVPGRSGKVFIGIIINNPGYDFVWFRGS
jgi:hypothetical protein